MRPLFTGLALVTATVITATGVRATSQDPQERPERGQRAGGRPSLVSSVRHDVSRPLRDVRPHEPKSKREPHPPLPLRQPRLAPRLVDPVLQTSTPIIAAPPTLFNFEGVNNVDSVLPPDTNGDIGPNHFVQWVNKTFAIYDRAGTVLYGPAAGSTVWDGFGGPCETQNDGDPIVLYDHLADRWLMTQFAIPNNFFGLLFAPFYQCIAISQTGDPTGAYYRYAYQFAKLNDYPKFGVWPDAYYMAINQFSEGNLMFAGQGVAAFDRSAMLNGQPAGMVYVDLASVDPNLGGMLPSDLDGPPPPAGAPNVFAQVDDGVPTDQLQLWRFHVDWTTPANSTFTLASLLPVASFDGNLCAQARACIPQPGTTAKLDALADRLMYRLQYRNFGTHESLVVNHTVDVDGNDHAGVRWYEIRDPNGTPSLHQQGTFAPDALHRWMASAAMDSAGNMAIAYNTGGSTLSPSIRYTARLATDPLGVMGQGENDLIHGSGSQTHSASRWGDYSMLTVDPVDGCTFWATAEYMAVTSLAGWQTRVGAFRLPGCGTSGPPPDAPLGLTATAVSSKRVNLAWADQSTSEDGFTIERCAGTAAACDASGAFTTVGQAAAGATSFGDSSLQPSTTYSFRVRAFNAGGTSDPTNTASATTLAPPSISVAATTATANEAGPVNGVFTITRDSQFASSLNVAFTFSGTATKGTDYQNPIVSVTIPVGQPSATVSIVPINDTTIEVPETVVMTLTSTADYVIGGSASSTVTIVSDDLSVDFVVTALTVPAVVAVGSTFDVTEATKNQGNDTAPPSSTSFTVSLNYLLEPTDPVAGARTVPELTPGTTHSATTSLTLPPTVGAGTWVLFAKADAQSQFAEGSEYNNTRTVTLKVGPDLTVATLTAPTIVAPGVEFAVTEATKNQGAGLAGPSTTKFYLSANFALDAGDTPLQSRNVGPLDTGLSGSATTMVTIPIDKPAGGYYLIATADDGKAVAEHTETNNAKYVFLNVGADLMVTGLTAPLKVASGGVISVTDTVKNNGAALAAGSITGFYISVNAALDATDTKLEETRTVPPLGAGLSNNGVTNVTLPTVTPGTWYLFAKADDPGQVAEAIETNNTKYTTLQVGPDLTVSAMTVPTTATMGSVITVSDTVRNQGGAIAGPSTTRFYLSLNTLFDANDTPLEGTREVGEIGINLSSTGTTTLTLPAGISGKYYIIAVADGLTVVAEAIETNNAVARLITISQ